mmetsp:Transcript_9211/g.23029  ORF Transcript_9211/g.23029 Transcript_9211/m.23029 type:complete len:240 (-) Transcript_9211:26-745(-)
MLRLPRATRPRRLIELHVAQYDHVRDLVRGKLVGLAHLENMFQRLAEVGAAPPRRPPRHLDLLRDAGALLQLHPSRAGLERQHPVREGRPCQLTDQDPQGDGHFHRIATHGPRHVHERHQLSEVHRPGTLAFNPRRLDGLHAGLGVGTDGGPLGVEDLQLELALRTVAAVRVAQLLNDLMREQLLAFELLHALGHQRLPHPLPARHAVDVARMPVAGLPFIRGRRFVQAFVEQRLPELE